MIALDILLVVFFPVAVVVGIICIVCILLIVVSKGKQQTTAGPPIQPVDYIDPPPLGIACWTSTSTPTLLLPFPPSAVRLLQAGYAIPHALQHGHLGLLAALGPGAAARPTRMMTDDRGWFGGHQIGRGLFQDGDGAFWLWLWLWLWWKGRCPASNVGRESVRNFNFICFVCPCGEEMAAAAAAAAAAAHMYAR